MPLNIIDNHFQQRRRHAPSTTDDPTCGASMPKRAAATTTTDPKRAAVEAAAPTAVIDPKRAAVEAAAPAASIDVLDRDLLSSVLLHLYSTEAAPAVSAALRVAPAPQMASYLTDGDRAAAALHGVRGERPPPKPI